MKIIRNLKQKDALDWVCFCGKQWNEGSARAVFICEREERNNTIQQMFWTARKFQGKLLFPTYGKPPDNKVT